MEERDTKIQESLDKIRQFNLSPDLIGDVETFIGNAGLTEIQANEMCRLIERAISQHYVKQLLKNSLIR
jgi:hypothetical protein